MERFYRDTGFIDEILMRGFHAATQIHAKRGSVSMDMLFPHRARRTAAKENAAIDGQIKDVFKKLGAVQLPAPAKK